MDDITMEAAYEAAETPEPSADLAPAPEAQPEQVDEGSNEPAIPSTFTVKVGGEEQQVTLEEALKGYQRQADYTRKTQELADQREQLSHADRLWQAFETNPQRTLEAVAEAYGIPLGAPQAQAAEEDPYGDEPLDPEEQRIAALEKFVEDSQRQQLEMQLDREMQALHTKYGVDFDEQELLAYAVDRSIHDLDAAFKAFAFDRMTKVAADRQVQQRKAEAPPIAGGHGVQAGAVTPGPGRPTSIAEAFAMAEAEMGLS